MQVVQNRSSAEALEAEILQAELQSRSLAAADGVQGKICIYCGFPAQDIDHVVPVSRQPGRRREFCKEFLVNSCRLCNLYLSARLFSTFFERLNWLRAKYESKLRYIDDMWDEEELINYDYVLRSFIHSGISRDRIFQTKLWWFDRMIRGLKLIEVEKESKVFIKKDLKELRKCKNCNSNYIPIRVNQSYCSYICSREWRRNAFCVRHQLPAGKRSKH
jgi:hypothetical protein